MRWYIPQFQSAAGYQPGFGNLVNYVALINKTRNLEDILSDDREKKINEISGDFMFVLMVSIFITQMSSRAYCLLTNRAISGGDVFLFIPRSSCGQTLRNVHSQAFQFLAHLVLPNEPI